MWIYFLKRHTSEQRSLSTVQLPHRLSELHEQAAARHCAHSGSGHFSRSRSLPSPDGIQRHGSIGVVELAELAGRDYTTVSRQVTKLESIWLIARHASKADKRVRAAVVTAKGCTMAAALDEARERLAAEVLANWNTKDLQDLVRLMRRFVDDLLAWRSRHPGLNISGAKNQAVESVRRHRRGPLFPGTA